MVFIVVCVAVIMIVTMIVVVNVIVTVANVVAAIGIHGCVSVRSGPGFPPSFRSFITMGIKSVAVSAELGGIRSGPAAAPQRTASRFWE